MVLVAGSREAGSINSLESNDKDVLFLFFFFFIEDVVGNNDNFFKRLPVVSSAEFKPSHC